MAQMGYVGDISVAIPSTATGGTAYLNGSNWTVVREKPPLSIAGVPWYIWAAGAAAAWWLMKRR